MFGVQHHPLLSFNPRSALLNNKGNHRLSNNLRKLLTLRYPNLLPFKLRDLQALKCIHLYNRFPLCGLLQLPEHHQHH